jgi:hypothetical protein
MSSLLEIDVGNPIGTNVMIVNEPELGARG